MLTKTKSSSSQAKSILIYERVQKLRFIAVHVATLVGVLYFGASAQSLALCVVLYFARMFGVTAGYHRYFSHRTFKTSRPFAFCLAFLAQSSAQKGVIWWASNHRHHHRYSDRKKDLHSPAQHGLFQAHVGWIFKKEAEEQRNNVKDLNSFWELRLLNKWPMLPATLLGIAVATLGGWEMFFSGFLLSTVLLFHGTFTINSLAHTWGKRRFKTKDTSRNNAFLALITLGEGWHNNHHYYMKSARQGFYWWEIDITYCILLMFKQTRLIWDVQEVPKEILQKGRNLDKQKARKEEQSITSSSIGA